MQFDSHFSDAQTFVSQIIETKNVIGETVTMRDQGTFLTQYRYDAFGNPREIEDAAGNKTVNSYDLRGRKLTMNDPDMGIWAYAYNAFGELTSQTDAKSQTVTMSYDQLGRLTSRVEAEGTSSWVYDTAANGIGKLASSSSAEGESKSFTYDSLGRPGTTTTTIDGTTYPVVQTYDSYSRVDTLTYPFVGDPTKRLTVKHVYANGYLAEVKNDGNGDSYWKADALTADGQVEEFHLGLTALWVRRTYDPLTGRLSTIVSNNSLGNAQDLSYDFDTQGNLLAREDHRLANPCRETFGYDMAGGVDSRTG